MHDHKAVLLGEFAERVRDQPGVQQRIGPILGHLLGKGVRPELVPRSGAAVLIDH